MIEPQSVEAARNLINLIHNFNSKDLNQEQEDVILVCTVLINTYEAMTGPI
jgi:hypothetical protein